MADIPKPSGNVLRRNPERECGQPVGQVNIILQGDAEKRLETISFYCNKPRLHLDACEFVGASVRVRANG